jgi:hypothetical protein
MIASVRQYYFIGSFSNMSRAFISFSFEDLNTVRGIVRELQNSYGITCWFCEMEVPYGEDYKDRIVMAIQDAQTVVLLHSKHAALSENVKSEIGVAKKERRYVIPCKLDHTDYKGGLLYDLVNENYLEATGISPEDFVRKLANEINRVIINKIAPERNTYKLSSYRTTRNEVFLGRETVLSDIHEAFGGRNIVFLHGMGGIGKTEIAQNYAKTYENDYKTIVFARYESSLASLLANDTVFDVKGLQRKTKADNTLQTDEEYARDKMAILKKICDTDTLVIIDNFDVNHDQDPLFHELVKDVPFRVLFTTRNRPSANYFTVPVSHLSDADLKKVFLAHMGASFVEEDDPDFPALFDMVEHHTLSVILLAKYADRISVDYVSELIQELKDQGFTALSEVSNGRVNGYESIKNLIRMARLTEEQAYFLRCLAIMPPQGVPWNMFMEWCSAYEERNGLIKLGYVDYDKEQKIIRMHPVIREVVWNEMGPSYENCRDFIQRVCLKRDIIPLLYHADLRKRLLYRDIFEYIKKIVEITDAITFQISKNILLFFANSNKYFISEGEIDHLLQKARELFGEDSSEVYLIYGMLGKKRYMFDCDYNEAMYHYKKTADYFIEHPLYENREAHMCIRSCADLFCNYARKETDEIRKNEFRREAEYYLKKADEYGENNIRMSIDERFRINITYQVRYSDNIRSKLCTMDGDYRTAHYYLDNCDGYISELEVHENRKIALDRASLRRERAILFIKEGKPIIALETLDKMRLIYKDHYNDDSIKYDSYYTLQCQCYSMLSDKRNLQIALDKLTRLAQKYYHESHTIYATINKYTEILKTM